MGKTTKKKKKPSLLSRIYKGTQQAREQILTGYEKVHKYAVLAEERRMFQVDLWGKKRSSTRKRKG